MRMKLVLLISTSCVALLILVALAYANWPTTSLPVGTEADSVLVVKHERKMIMLHEGRKIKEYVVALGKHPTGKKSTEGDGMTPEGSYLLDYRNPHSSFHLSLHLSYPDHNDVQQARARSVSAGGDIMVHGLRKGLGWLGRFHRFFDWTDGCIAVTNSEMEELWRFVPDGTPIEIRP